MKRKELLINLGLVFGSLLFLWLILEGVFRLPLIVQKTGGNWPKLKQWMDYVWYNERNSLGFRDREHPFEKPKNTYRILILGDSVTYGQMVNYQEIYPVVLEKKLNTEDKNVEIIKMALMGWNTMEEFNALVNYGLRFDPDIVVVGFYLNDPQVKHNPRWEETADPERRLLPLTGPDQWLNEKSYFYSFVRWRYNRFLEKIGFKDDYKTWQKGLYNQNLRGWRDFEFTLNQIAVYSKQAGAKIILVDLNIESGWDRESSQVKNLAGKLSIPVLEMRQYFTDQDFANLVVSPSDWHPNAKVHQIYAQVLEEYIVDKFLNIR